MPRKLIALLLVAGVAHAQPVDDPDGADAMPDQSLGAAMGLAGGGRVTPGGLRIAGHWLYQLSAQDWFDGTAAFTFGGGGAECYRDRMDFVICDHGFAEGRGVEIVAAVRRYFVPQGKYRPFARAGVGVSIVRFGDDDVTGLAIPLHLGGGVRAHLSKQVAVVALADLVAGIGRFNRGMGTEPQLGVAVTAGAELRLP
jgi:hypothetical protein